MWEHWHRLHSDLQSNAFLFQGQCLWCSHAGQPQVGTSSRPCTTSWLPWEGTVQSIDTQTTYAVSTGPLGTPTELAQCLAV